MSNVRSTSLRQVRERDLVSATRRLFDERGMQDAPIEEIARSVGIARGLIYRQFASKEELFVLTVTDYLAELAELIRTAMTRSEGPAKQLDLVTEAYARFCLRYPAFLDCSLSLMRRPAMQLREEVSESVWLRLGQGMASCIEPLTTILRQLDAEDPEYTSNVLWTQTLGTMHLARSRVGLRQLGPGVPDLFRIDDDRVVASCVAAAVALVRS
ncbi:MAG TPA: helix-turn-helix domain-containing protein [Thermoleophilaceae bacterium]|nr:helix-turn-helix domain-containing protein [Thermoleophilaceae bacterium]